ncbi:MAG TPA: Holliday junction branch migration protein RuvA [Thermomicrobiales bacterium]|nr:Holliday junction branch migration protein RuvA [Thermomicrobiales bacterium]
MIAGLIGSIHRAEQDAILVNVHGVLYRVFTTGRVVSTASEQIGEREFFTHQVVREDAQLLYGFLTPADLQWFQTLISVNGVGPRMALAVLTRFSADELLSVIANEQIDLLVTVPGVGKRTASRMILDLRGKLPENLETPVSLAGLSNPDALEALQALGYTFAEARSALGHVKLADDATVEDHIVAALRELGGD